jgi:hypothetical protein
MLISSLSYENLYIENFMIIQHIYITAISLLYSLQASVTRNKYLSSVSLLLIFFTNKMCIRIESVISKQNLVILVFT